jgi:hypothetical protein
MMVRHRNCIEPLAYLIDRDAQTRCNLVELGDAIHKVHRHGTHFDEATLVIDAIQHIARSRWRRQRRRGTDHWQNRRGNRQVQMVMVVMWIEMVWMQMHAMLSRIQVHLL